MLSIGDVENAIDKLDNKEDEEFKKIFRLLYGQNLKLNLFQRFNVNKIFEIRILSVDSKFRGQGIAKNLLLKSEEIAEQNEFKVIMIYSSKIILLDILFSRSKAIFSHLICTHPKLFFYSFIM